MRSTNLEEYRRKVSEGVRRHYATPEGQLHRQKLSESMKRFWRRIKGEEDGE